MRIKLCQISPRVGHVEYNIDKIINYYNDAVDEGCDICVFPELITVGYLSNDLLHRPSFIQKIEKANNEIISQTKSTYLILPTILVDRYSNTEKPNLYNGVIFAYKGKQIGTTRKRYLPDYDIFKESRYFVAANNINHLKIGNINIMVPICQDIWSSDFISSIEKESCDIIIIVNASPFTKSKIYGRYRCVWDIFKTISKPIIYCNNMFAHDGVVFDGNSFIYDKTDFMLSNKNDNIEDTNSANIYPQLRLCAESFNEDSSVIEYSNDTLTSNKKYKFLSHYENIYSALIVGLRSYVYNNGFDKVIIGLSGGIDSAFVTSLAVDAFGPNKVIIFMLSSKYNSKRSMDDAELLAENLSLKINKLSIDDILNSYVENLFLKNSGGPRQNIHNYDTVTENLQARIRGTMLMAISNKFGNALLLATGNKSEYATGYTTLYGDMCGGFAPIKDLYKTELYELVKYRNNNILPNLNILNNKLNIIPNSIIEKPPSAELSFDQKDSDFLPEYDLLDQILKLYIDELYDTDHIVACGYDKELVDFVIKLVKKSEFKRNQSAIGIKISDHDFDSSRQYPITHYE